MASKLDTGDREGPLTRAYLAAVQYPDGDPDVVGELLDELGELVRTLGLAVTGRCVARLARPQSRYLVGAGKAEEIAAAARESGADVIVFDDALTPSQQRNWESLTEMAVIDRQEAILGIFGMRAQTREAVLQVSLAQARYSLPRLKRRWTHLSRQRGMRGGAGLRGEGEQQIEVDGRLVKRRIQRLQGQLEEVRQQRATQRKMRLRKSVPVVAIVGYTNAGKSSLLNALTQAGVFVEDRLFATLDPAVRRLTLPDGREVLLVDTVGFVRKLPHQLVEAFKSTLEEAVVADYLLEVLDVTSPAVEEHHAATEAVLAELGAAAKPRLLVFNKIDRVANTYLLPRLRKRHPGSLFISALTGAGLAGLCQHLEQAVTGGLRRLELLVPHSRYDIIALIHRSCGVVSEEHLDEGTRIVAHVPDSVVSSVDAFLVSDDA